MPRRTRLTLVDDSVPTDAPSPSRRLNLTVVEEHDCPYLPGRRARFLVGPAAGIAPAEYRELMDENFRRSGSVVYRPVCEGCRECRQLRVLVDRFTASKSDRRILRRNADLVVTASVPKWTTEKAELYARYLRDWHQTDTHAVEQAGDDLRAFLYEPAVASIEMEYRTSAGKLVGVGILDVAASALSSVYFYFDATERKRSLGHYSMLREIELARQAGMTHHYLGYFVANCRKMAYKRRYRPCEVLSISETAWQGSPDGRTKPLWVLDTGVDVTMK